MIAARHAIERLEQMGLDWSEVIEVVARPEIIYPSPRSHGPDRWISVGGRLAVVHRGCVVITVLWRGQQTSDRSA